MSKLKILILTMALVTGLSSCSNFKEALGFGASEGSLVPTGEFTGAWKFKNQKEVKQEERDIASKVMVTLFPMDDVDITGNGVLTFNNASHRFTWRANGNRTDTWNILFTKDNNVFSDITSSFNFDGTLKTIGTGFKLLGSLKMQEGDEVASYFIETFKKFPPKIVTEAALAATAGETLKITGMYFGEKASELELKLKAKGEAPKKGKGKKGAGTEAAKLKISSIGEAGEKAAAGSQLLSIDVPADFAKGDYSLKIHRHDGYESNSVVLTVQ